MQTPEYVTRSWVNNENRFILGNAQPDNCAACGNVCPCDSANRTNGAYDASLSHMLLRYQPFGEDLPLEVPVSLAGPICMCTYIYLYDLSLATSLSYILRCLRGCITFLRYFFEWQKSGIAVHASADEFQHSSKKKAVLSGPVALSSNY